jgi:hypothetical protein
VDCLYIYELDVAMDWTDVKNKKGPSLSTLGLLAVRGSHNPLFADVPVSHSYVFLLYFHYKPCATKILQPTQRITNEF